MIQHIILFFGLFLVIPGQIFGQTNFIYSKEGRAILDRKQVITNCLRSMNKDKNDKTALSICECQVDKMNRYFTNKQYRKYTNSGVIDMSGLIKDDSLMEKKIQECFTSSGKTILMQAEGFESKFIAACIKNIRETTEKKLDNNRLTKFCSCQLDLVRTKKLTDAEMETLSNPNSLLFYEILYKCGDPFSEKVNTSKAWNEKMEGDITGPASDTITILTLNGMTYVKMKTGSKTQIWLLDTGASDLLINQDTETFLKNEHLIGSANYLGIGEYEMANGMVDTCRKYLVNNITIGKFTLNNIIIAVTDKGKRIIAGKGLLNKFSSWALNNKNNTLILNR